MATESSLGRSLYVFSRVEPLRLPRLKKNLVGKPVLYRLVGLLAAAPIAGLLACGGSASDSVAPPRSGGTAASIAISPSAPPAVTLGSQLALQAEVHDPSGQTVPGATVFWSSADTTVATVSSVGVVTGAGVGSTQVAASSGGQSAVVPVAVVPVAVASLAIVPASANVTIGGTVSLTAVTYDAAGHALAGRPVVWASSSSQVATVDASGKVTGVSAGSATITGTSEGKTGASSVTVTLVPVAAVSVSPGSASLTIGRTASLSAVTTDASGNVLSGRSVTWSSSNSAVATVSAQGLVSSLTAGTATISATSEGKIGNAQVVVTAPPPPSVASVSVTPPTRDLDIGGSATLIATLKDSTGAILTGRTITWATSAASIATVSNTGLVTAIGAGTATITATSGGVTGTAAVIVNPAPPTVAVARVKISPSSATLRNNQTRTLTVQVLDASNHVLTGRTVTWTSSGSDAVRLTRTGPTTASVKGSGTGIGITTVTATCEGVSDSIVVTFVE